MLRIFAFISEPQQHDIVPLMKDSRTALLLGASGLVGRRCLDLLLNDQAYSKVTVLVRRALAVEHPKLQQHVIDFDQLSQHSDLIKALDIFCCLGSTIKKAGSEEAFRKVDFAYPLEVAAIAHANGAQQFLLVSSMSADPKARIFYSRVKGEVEQAISRIPYHGVQIFHPSLLIGERVEFRLGEKLAQTISRGFSFLFVGPLKKYRPIHAHTVAVAMVKVAKKQFKGVNSFESSDIREVAGGD